MKKTTLNILALLGMCLSLPLFAQEPAAAKDAAAATSATVAAAADSGLKIETLVPWILAITTVALGIVIIFMGSLLSRVAIMKMKNTTKVMVLLLISLAATNLQAASTNATGYHMSSSQLNFILLGVIFFEVLVILYFANWLKAIVLPKAEKAVATKTSAWWDKFNKSVSVDNEKDVQLDHEYDGIKELNNALPPWWLYGFYLTIVFAGIYVYRYHIGKTAPLQVQELNIELAQAKADAEAYAKTAANKVDENTIEYNADASLIADGKELFGKNCVACHGAEAGGGQGPNLTDDYWKHGGSIKNIFKTIKVGVPEMGMIAWGQTLTPKQIASLATFIKSIKGTKPSNPKAPEGQLYSEEGGAAPADSSATAPKTQP